MDKYHDHNLQTRPLVDNMKPLRTLSGRSLPSSLPSPMNKVSDDPGEPGESTILEEIETKNPDGTVLRQTSFSTTEGKRLTFTKGKTETVDFDGDKKGIKILDQPKRYWSLLADLDQDQDGYLTLDDILNWALTYHKLRKNYKRVLLGFFLTVTILGGAFFVSTYAAVELSKEVRVSTHKQNVLVTSSGGVALVGSAESSVRPGGVLVARGWSGSGDGSPLGAVLATRMSTPFANVTAGSCATGRLLLDLESSRRKLSDAEGSLTTAEGQALTDWVCTGQAIDCSPLVTKALSCVLDGVGCDQTARVGDNFVPVSASSVPFSSLPESCQQLQHEQNFGGGPPSQTGLAAGAQQTWDEDENNFSPSTTYQLRKQCEMEALRDICRPGDAGAVWEGEVRCPLEDVCPERRIRCSGGVCDVLAPTGIRHLQACGAGTTTSSGPHHQQKIHDLLGAANHFFEDHATTSEGNRFPAEEEGAAYRCPDALSRRPEKSSGARLEDAFVSQFQQCYRESAEADFYSTEQPSVLKCLRRKGTEHEDPCAENFRAMLVQGAAPGAPAEHPYRVGQLFDETEPEDTTEWNDEEEPEAPERPASIRFFDTALGMDMTCWRDRRSAVVGRRRRSWKRIADMHHPREFFTHGVVFDEDSPTGAGEERRFPNRIVFAPAKRHSDSTSYRYCIAFDATCAVVPTRRRSLSGGASVRSLRRDCPSRNHRSCFSRDTPVRKMSSGAGTGVGGVVTTVEVQDLLCCNKVKLSACKRRMIHAKFMRNSCL